MFGARVHLGFFTIRQKRIRGGSAYAECNSGQRDPAIVSLQLLAMYDTIDSGQTTHTVYIELAEEARLEVNEMAMLRWMCGVTRRDNIRNEHIRGTTRVEQTSKKITEKRLKWYGHCYDDERGAYRWKH